MTETSRIRWEPTDFDGFTGHVGTEGLEVFRLWQCDKHEGEWTLAADLPGESAKGNGSEELKAEAERWLSEFVASLGAVFPPETADREREDVLRKFAPPAPTAKEGQ